MGQTSSASPRLRARITPFLIMALLLCAASIGRSSRADSPAPVALPDPVAVVDGVAISEAETQKALADWQRHSRKSVADLPNENKLKVVRSIVDQLIEKQLIDARSSGVEITDKEVEACFKGIEQKNSGLKTLKEQLEAENLTEDGFKEQLRDQLRREKWLTSSLFGQDEASEDDAKAFYDAHPEKFEMLEMVRASMIFVGSRWNDSPELAANKLKIIHSAADRIKGGEAFEKVAAEVSEVPPGFSNRGDFGWLTRDSKPAEMVETAFTLKTGEVSKVKVSGFGFYLVKTTDRKAARHVPFEEAKSNIITGLTRKNRAELAGKLLADIRSKADVKINLPATFATRQEPETTGSAAGGPVHAGLEGRP